MCKHLAAALAPALARRRFWLALATALGQCGAPPAAPPASFQPPAPVSESDPSFTYATWASVAFGGYPALLGVRLLPGFPVDPPRLHVLSKTLKDDVTGVARGRAFETYEVPWSPRWGAWEQGQRVARFLEEKLPAMWGPANI